jgi:hypothetical protein
MGNKHNKSSYKVNSTTTKKTRPLSACFNNNTTTSNNNLLIKNSKSDYTIKNSLQISESNDSIISKNQKKSIKTYLITKIQKKTKKKSSISTKNLHDSTEDNNKDNKCIVVRSMTDTNFLNVIDTFDNNNNNDIVKPRFTKSPPLYNIHEIDNRLDDNDIKISDLLHRSTSFDSLSIINDDVNYFSDQPVEIIEENIINNDNKKPELGLLNEVNKKLNLYKTNLVEQSYFYYGNTTQYDVSSKFSVSSVFISQAPLASSECTTTNNSSCNNLTKLEVFNGYFVEI